jgi:hypothetical protein
LPDGRHFLFLATGTPEVQGIYLGTLDSTDAVRLVAADTAACSRAAESRDLRTPGRAVRPRG